MASNNPKYPRQTSSQPIYPSSSATWMDQNTRSEPCASNPAPSAPAAQRRTAVPPTNPHYLTMQHGGLGHSPHGGAQPGLYPESAQRTQMDDRHYHPSYATSPRPHESSVGGSTARREIDRPKIQVNQPAPRRITSGDSSTYFAARTDHSYRSAQRENNTTAPSMGYLSGPPSQGHSAQDSSSNANDMSNMLSEFSLASSSSSSSASPISPYYDRTSLRPSMYTMQVQSNSLEAVEDPEGRGGLYSLIESTDDMYHMDTSKNAGTGSHSPHSPPLMTDRRGRWSGPPVEANHRAYDNPSRSASSQSSTSHSTSDSDISSLPIGTGPPGRSPASSSTSGAPRRNKMHQCKLCGKWFPRPSGLDTHMNSHSGAKPYKCPVQDCDKAFAVRSNAKRHLKTHGVPPSSADSHGPQPAYNVGFEPPFVTHNYQSGGAIPELKWVQTGSAMRMANDGPDSPSGSDEVDGGPVPPSPLSAVYPPVDGQNQYDGTHPYHSKPW